MKFSITTSAGLKAWLEAKSRWLPHEKGPGRRHGQNLSRYIEMILVAHRQSKAVEDPIPEPLPPEDQSVLDAIRALRERQRSTFLALLQLVGEAGRSLEAARVVEAVAALVGRSRSTRGRAGTARKS